MSVKETSIDFASFKVLELGVKNTDVVVSPESKFDSVTYAKTRIEKRLVFSGIVLGDLDNGISPTFLCPDCRRKWNPKLDFGLVDKELFDFNDQITVAIPEHTDSKGLKCACSGGVISLFYAVHIEKGKVQVCIQRADAEGAEGARADWWKYPEEQIVIGEVVDK